MGVENATCISTGMVETSDFSDSGAPFIERSSLAHGSPFNCQRGYKEKTSKPHADLYKHWDGLKIVFLAMVELHLTLYGLIMYYEGV